MSFGQSVITRFLKAFTLSFGIKVDPGPDPRVSSQSSVISYLGVLCKFFEVKLKVSLIILTHLLQLST